MTPQLANQDPTSPNQLEAQNLHALKQCIQMMQQHRSRFQMLIEDPASGERFLIMERDDRLQDQCISIRGNAQKCEIMSDCFPIDRDHMGFQINARFDKLTEQKTPLSPSFYEVVDFMENLLADLPCIPCERISHLTKTRYIWEPDKTNAWRG